MGSEILLNIYIYIKERCVCIWEFIDRVLKQRIQVQMPSGARQARWESPGGREAGTPYHSVAPP